MSRQAQGALFFALFILVTIGIVAAIVGHHDALGRVAWLPVAQGGAPSSGVPFSFRW